MTLDTISVESEGALAVRESNPRAELFGDLRRRPVFWVGVAIIVFWILAALLGQLISGGPLNQSLLATNASPSGSHLFGTDQLGRDVLSRVLVGARSILITAPLATLLGTVCGTVIGLVMGYFRGLVDDVIGRFIEAFMALPLVVSAIIGVVALGSSNLTMILIIGIVFTPLIARTVRSAVLLEREQDYVAAARLRGESAAYVMFVEILPNVLAPIMVEFTVRVGYAVFTLVTLSFLGFGLQPPSPSWGADIYANLNVVAAGYWWEVLFDALAIASLVIAINLISNAIETVLEDS